MNQEYVAKFYQPGDEKQIVPLIIDAFKIWPFFDLECSPIDHWRWKYLDNPDHKSMLLNVAYNDRIIAVGHNLMYNILIKGKQYLGAYGTDACVHPSFQGKGIYRILTKEYNEKEQGAGIEFVYMATVNPKIINSKTQRTGTPHSFPFKIRYMSRIEDIDLHMQANELGLKWKLGKIIKKARSSPLRPPDPTLQIEPVTRFNETISGFLEKVHQRYDFIKMRTIENLNWRYLDPRAGNYQVRAIYENGQVTGYGVFRINKQEEYHTGYVVDLLTLPDRLDIAEALFLDGLNYFRLNNVNEVVYQVVENHPYEKMVSKYGFSAGKGNRYFFYNNWGYDGKILDNISPEKFHFVFGDLTGI